MMDPILATSAAALEAGLLGKGALTVLAIVAVLLLRALFIDLMSRG